MWYVSSCGSCTFPSGYRKAGVPAVGGWREEQYAKGCGMIRLIRSHPSIGWVIYSLSRISYVYAACLSSKKKPKQMDTMPFEQRARFQSRAARESASCSNKHIYHTSEINLTIQPARLLDYYPKLISLSTMYWKLQPVAHSVVHVSRCHERQGSTF